MEHHIKKIEGVVDRYKGLEIIDLSSLEPDEKEFEKQLEHNMILWRQDQIRSV
jgi:hypothetical protein